MDATKSADTADLKVLQLESLLPECQNFYQFHGVQLAANRFPPTAAMVTQLYTKLTKEIYDAGEYFEVIENQETEQFEVVAKKDIEKNSCVFMVDHALSFRYDQLRELLRVNAPLRARLQNILKFCGKRAPIPSAQVIKTASDAVLEKDAEGLVDASALHLGPNIITLSLYGNNFSDPSAVLHALEKCPNLKAAWFNENPVIESHGEELLKTVEAKFPNIELWNSKYTKNAGEWALKYTTFGGDLLKINTSNSGDIRALNAEGRNVFAIANIPAVFSHFPKLRTINLKDHEVDSLEVTNQLFSIMKTCKKLKNIDVDHKVYEILYDLHKLNKLSEVTTSLKSVNGFELAYAPIESIFPDCIINLRL